MLTYQQAKLCIKLNVRAVTHAMLAKLVDIYFAESENTKGEVVPWEVIL